MGETDTGKMLAAHIATCDERHNMINEALERLRMQTSPKSGLFWYRQLVIGLPLLLAVLGATAYGLDQRYVTQQYLEAGFRASRILTLEDEIFKLSQIPVDARTQNERARLERYKLEHERLLQEQSNKN